MASTKTIRTHAKDEFAGASGDPNPLLFLRDLSLLGLTVQPLNVKSSLGNIEIEWSAGVPTPADLAIVDTAVIDHAGGVITSKVVEVESIGLDADNVGEEVEKVGITGKNFKAGRYQVSWSAEIADADIILYLNDEAISSSTNSSSSGEARGAVLAVTAENGERLNFSLRFVRRNGAFLGTARRAHLIVSRLGN